MSNSTLYHFKDFTHENYRRLIILAKKNYIFRTYLDFARDERFIIWRHDVDISMHIALKLANIEYEENIRTTYFLHLHSIFYNLLEPEITDRVKDILVLGHQIGLHFDSHFYGIENEEQLNARLSQEKRILEDLFGQEIRVFSFHITTPFTRNCTQWEYTDMICTSAAYFQEEVGYCSDSNGYWRFRRLEDVLQNAQDERLQILTHPAWWQETVMSPRERLDRCINGRAKKTRDTYEKIVKEFDRAYVDWD